MSTTQILTVCRILFLGLIVATTYAHAENSSNASARIDEIITVDLKKHEVQSFIQSPISLLLTSKESPELERGRAWASGWRRALGSADRA